jgi:hypothetical protein
VDLLDVNGCIVDLKTSSKKQNVPRASQKLQLTIYTLITPGASGQCRIDTTVKTKTPQLVQQRLPLRDGRRPRPRPHFDARGASAANRAQAASCAGPRARGWAAARRSRSAVRTNRRMTAASCGSPSFLLIHWKHASQPVKTRSASPRDAPARAR